MVGMGLWSAATAITGLASNLASLFGARMLMGASESSAFPSVGRLIRGWVPRSRFGFANMVAISGGYAGPAVGAIVFGWLASMFGWRVGFAIVGCRRFSSGPCAAGVTDRPGPRRLHPAQSAITLSC
jgi:MFS family permease